MELKDGRITILFSGEHGLTVELYDADAGCTFADATLSPEEACEALSRVGHSKCKMHVRNLNKVGKKQLYKPLVFRMPDDPNDPYHNARVDVAIKEAKRHTPKGWEADEHYRSQDSFFSKDGKYYAKTMIRRWE